MAKFGGAEVGPMPVVAPTQGLANMVGGAVSQLPADFMDPVPQGPTPMTPEQQAAAQMPTPPTPPAMPPVAAKPAIPAALPAQPNPLRTVEPTPAPAQPAAPAQPQIGSEYNDAARQQLYAQLAEKRKENAGWAAAGSLGDMAMRMGGNTPIGTQQNILAQGNKEEAAAREQFEAGRKGRIEDIGTNLSLKKAGREETEYQDQNDPNSQQSKLAVALAMKYAPDQAKQMGWAAGKSTYADVIKVLPIMEKINSAEAAKSNKALALSEKTDQFNSNKTRQFREEVMGGKPYQSYLTVHGMAKSVRMAAQNPTAYGDLSSIYALVKGLDPTSVVREGEIGLMREVTGLKDKLSSTLEKWGGKGPINASMMKDIERVMGRLEQIAADNVRAHAAPTLNQARSMKLNENEIMGDLPTGASQAAPTADPAAQARRSRIAQLRAELGK